MTKIVINACHGGFSLSVKGQKLYAELSGFELFHYIQVEYGHSGGIDKYKKGTDDNFYPLAFKKDFGDGVFSIQEEDWERYYFCGRDLKRTDELLIQVVEKLGSEADGTCAELNVVEVPDGIEWEIKDYDGFEHIAEKHRTWS